MRKLLSFMFLTMCALMAPTLHAQTTCGTTSVQATSTSLAYLIGGASTCIPAASSTITDCKLYTSGTAVNSNCALYDSDGTGASPGTTLCQGTTTTSNTGGWTTIPISGCPTLTAGHTYWIGTWLAGANYRRGSGNSVYYKSGQTCCSFTSQTTWSTTPLSPISVYLDLAPVGGGGGTTAVPRKTVTMKAN